jgi:hypothetical protein
VFEEDFGLGFQGDGWTYPDQNCSWSTEPGHQMGSSLIMHPSAGGNRGLDQISNSLLRPQLPSCTAIEVKVNMDSNAEKGKAGLIWYTDSSNYVLLVLGAGGGGLYALLASCANGTTEEIKKVDLGSAGARLSVDAFPTPHLRTHTHNARTHARTHTHTTHAEREKERERERARDRTEREREREREREGERETLPLTLPYSAPALSLQRPRLY